MRHFLTTSGLVYFIRPIGQSGPTKIGYSIRPLNRLDALMSWSPFPLEIVAVIPADISLEQRIHGIFADLHSHHEWFRADQRLTDFVAALMAGKPIGDLVDLSARIVPFRVKPMPKRSEDRRRYISYAARLRWAYKPLWARDDTARHPPQDVAEIFDRWRGSQRRRVAPTPPTPAELERIEQVIANPAQHAQTSAEKWPEELAA